MCRKTLASTVLGLFLELTRLRDDSDNILKSTYEKAIVFYRDQYKGRRKDDLTSFFESSSVDDVMALVRKTEQQHVTRKEGKSRVSAFLSSGWTNTVSRINTFSSVIDVLVSTHPDHQELSSKVVESFAAIGDALPELNFLAKQLYPVPHIQRTLAGMYTHIIDFCLRALKWYHKAGGGFFKKAFATMKDPWALEFEDVVHQIRQTNARIREQAEIAHQAETRHISLKISDVQLEVLHLRKESRNLKSLLVSGPAHPSFGYLNPLLPPEQPLSLPSIPFVPEKMSKYFQSIPFDPDKALSHGRAMLNLQRARENSNWDEIWASTKLRNWISQQGSAVVELQGSFAAPDVSRYFTFDMIDLVKSTDLPLAWYASSRVPSTSLKGPMTVTDILRSLVQQLLSQNPDTFATINLTESELASCNTEEEWLCLLVAVLVEIPRVVLILDSHGPGRQVLDAVRKFWGIVDERNVTTAIKMLLLTYPAPGTLTPAILPNDDMASSFTLTLGDNRWTGSAAAQMRDRGQRRTLPRQGGGPSQFKPFVLQLMELKRDSGDGS
ncbi:hypothetical protein G7Z17_g7564 [Cylindrodendrum hubeiense]|uniref:DUF7708 domain-containing protein n=1 Tax=Cylindrodendrum hubeiense TaxID=595255 RepID=A0A9P5H7M9_9HYPO|nr:hypothetical protein G7Z17_g7564 [Cylindrodendrum hubeiense]